MSDSQRLLAEYSRTGSETAFRELVSSYVDLVYSTAFRIVGRDRAFAEEVTQTVFLDLSQKAKSLSPGVMLGGWLHRNTCFVASKAVRSEQRRRERERQAVEMNTLMNEPESNFADVVPILDEAVNEMAPEDRLAVVLRFYERRDFQSIGSAVGTTADGARMRVNRALERLHGLLRQKGVTLSGAALGSALASEAVTAAPAHLVGKVVSAVLAGSSGSVGFLTVLSKFGTLAGGVKIAAVLLVSTVVVTLVGSHISRRQHVGQPIAGQVSSIGSPAKGGPPHDFAGAFRKSSVTRPTADDLATAKQELRALLERPQQQVQYPPRPLVSTLIRFGPEWLEAIPILLERADTADFETRRWALYGLWHMFVNLSSVPPYSPAPEIQAQAWALARPKLSAIFTSPSEPVELRRIATQILVPAWSVRRDITDAGEQTLTPPQPLDEVTMADIIAVLQSKDKKSEGFRFELVQPLLSQQVASFPEEARTIRNALAPLLDQGDPKQQFLAAFAMVAIPGEKPPGLVNILMRELNMRVKTDFSYTYRAADALGMMGAEAKEAVPSLLAFAEGTKNWGTSGYRERAMEAACRIQPDLRPQYPEIDAKLKAEEAAQPVFVSTPSTPRRFANQGAALADPVMGTNVLGMLVAQVEDADDPNQKGQELISELLTLWGSAPESEREPIQRAIDSLRTATNRTAAVKLPPASLRALLIDGRVLLVDQKVTSEPALHELFNQWDAWYR